MLEVTKDDEYSAYLQPSVSHIENTAVMVEPSNMGMKFVILLHYYQTQFSMFRTKYLHTYWKQVTSNVLYNGIMDFFFLFPFFNIMQQEHRYVSWSIELEKLGGSKTF